MMSEYHERRGGVCPGTRTLGAWSLATALLVLAALPGTLPGAEAQEPAQAVVTSTGTGTVVTAQEPAQAVVRSTGTGTVFTRPTHAVFWLHHTFAADSLAAALQETGTVEQKLRDLLAERELRPASMEVSSPAVISLADRTVRTSFELQFSVSSYSGGAAGAVKFGELCDQILELGGQLSCAISGPHLITTEQAAVIQEAVQEAAKNAYTAAAGAAAALGASIRAVDRVEVGEETKWNTPPGTEAPYPAIDEISCTVETRITYLLEYP